MTTKKKTAKTAKQVKLVHTQWSWDWRGKPSLKDLQYMLEPFGIHVINHPALEGQDAYGFIFSNRPLTQEELDEERDQQ